MSFESLSSILRAVFDRPLYCLFIGFAFILFAPGDYKWLSSIFLSIVFARIVEILYLKYCEWRVSRQETASNILKKKQIEATALALYDELNEREKHIINSCILHNESVYQAVDVIHTNYIINLVDKGFGKSKDSGRKMLFKGEYFDTIRRLKGSEINDAYGKKG